jgi:hypothetical protein
MRLPAAERAYVDPAKVRDYLLSPVHPQGRFKADFFRRLGYTRPKWPRLHRDLKDAATHEGAIPAALTVFGQLFELRVMLRGPSGRAARIVTIWIIRREEDFPRFVTAYPGAPR